MRFILLVLLLNCISSTDLSPLAAAGSLFFELLSTLWPWESNYSLSESDYYPNKDEMNRWSNLQTITNSLTNYLHEGIYNDWVNNHGQNMQRLFISSTDKSCAIENILVLLGTLGMSYPDIPKNELLDHLDFDEFCDSINEFDCLENRVYHDERETLIRFTGHSQLFAICPNIAATMATKISVLRAHLSILKVAKPRDRYHFKVDAANAFESSEELLLSPVHVLRRTRFTVTTAGLSKTNQLSAWFRAVNADLPTVDSYALGRFLAMCLVYSESTPFAMQMSLAEAILDKGHRSDADADWTSEQISVWPKLVQGFHELIPKDLMTELSAADLLAFLSTPPESHTSTIVVPFLAAPRSQLAETFMEMRPTRELTVVRTVVAYIKTRPQGRDPLEEWKLAGGPELLQLAYNVFAVSPDDEDLRVKTEALKALMILFAANRNLDAEVTGMATFGLIHGNKLETLLVRSVLTGAALRETLLGVPNRFHVIASYCFAADWFIQLPSVLASTYLKGIALSHMLLRDIATSPSRVQYVKALMSVSVELQEYQESVSEIEFDEEEELVGREIGWSLLNHNSTSIYQFPLSAYEAALDERDPVGSGLRSVIPSASVDHMIKLGITASMLHEMATLDPAHSGDDSSDSEMIRDMYVNFYGGNHTNTFLTLCQRLAEGYNDETSTNAVKMGLTQLCNDRPKWCFDAFTKDMKHMFGLNWLQKLSHIFPEFWNNHRQALFQTSLKFLVKNRGTPDPILRHLTVRPSHVLEDSLGWLNGPAGCHHKLDRVYFTSDHGNPESEFNDWFTSLAAKIASRALTSGNAAYRNLKPDSTSADWSALGRIVALTILLNRQTVLSLPPVFYGILLGTPDLLSLIRHDDQCDASHNIIEMDPPDPAEHNMCRGTFNEEAMEVVRDNFHEILAAIVLHDSHIASGYDLKLLVEGAPTI